MQSLAFSLLFVACVALAQGAATPSLKDKVVALSKKCAAETKVTPEQSKILFKQEVPKSDEEKCFLECVYKGVGVVNNNKFDLEGVKKLAALRFPSADERSQADKVVGICDKEIASASSEGKCALGKNVRECFIKNGKGIQFIPSP